MKDKQNKCNNLILIFIIRTDQRRTGKISSRCTVSSVALANTSSLRCGVGCDSFFRAFSSHFWVVWLPVCVCARVCVWEREGHSTSAIFKVLYVWLN